MIASVIFNLLIVLCTVVTLWIDIKKAGAAYLLRFFTVLSNLLCALSALPVALFRLAGDVPNGVLIFKHVGTAAVTVTLLVTVFYLWPILKDFKGLFTGTNLFLHVLCPLFAILSLLAWDRPAGGFEIVLLGVLPVLLYGCYYMYRVLLAPEGKRWDDFYHFTGGGKYGWLISFGAVAFLAFLISLLLRLR